MKSQKFKLLSLLILLLDATSIVSQNIRTDEIFVGKIKSITATVTPQTGKPETRIITKYGSAFNNNNKEIEWWSQEGSVTLLMKGTCTYDKKGNKLEIKRFFGDQSAGKNSYKYDTKNNLIEEQRVLASGIRDLKIIYTYNDKNNLIREERFDDKESVILKIVSSFNEKGFCVERKRFMNDSTYDKDSYVYNEKGNCIEETVNYSTSKFIIKSKYDDKGRVTEQSQIDGKGTFVSKYTATYDELGNMLNYRQYNSNGTLKEKRTYSYTYDLTGNWTKFYSFLNGEPDFLTERTIVYLN